MHSSEEDATFLADSDPNWVQFTAPGARTDLSEGHLSNYEFAAGETIELGAAWLQYFEDETDISFSYLDGNALEVDGSVTFIGNGGESYLYADLNLDGVLDRLDWNEYVAGLGTRFDGQSVAESYFGGDLTGDLVNNHEDFLAFRDAFDAVNGEGAFAQMIPEPSALLMGLLGFAVLVGIRRLSEDR